MVEADGSRLVFDRICGGQHLRCSFNLSDTPVAHRSAGAILLATTAVAEDALGAYAAVIEVIA